MKTPMAELARMNLTTLVLKSEHGIRFFNIEGDVGMFQKPSFFGLIGSRRTFVEKRAEQRLGWIW